ncbi:MAG: hypothetical protein HQK54_00200 [Oligoflexales bacterium]|nr:hypothetical protein [Oligoflexales bacterium]
MTLPSGSIHGFSWPLKIAIWFNGKNERIAPDLSEKLTRKGWTIPKPLSQIGTLTYTLREKKIPLIIVDDSPQMPVQLVLRYLLMIKSAHILPIICIVDENLAKSKDGILSLPNINIIKKPYNTTTFISYFENIISKWTSSPYNYLLNTFISYYPDKKSDFTKRLMELSKIDELRAMTSPSLALVLRERSNETAAEKFLLNALKINNNNISLIVSLVDLYISKAMPGMALRLLNAANEQNPNNPSLYLDNLQVNIMLNNIENCIPILKDMIGQNYLKNFAEDMLSRILYANERTDQLNMLIKQSPTLAQSFGLHVS